MLPTWIDTVAMFAELTDPVEYSIAKRVEAAESPIRSVGE